jgi:hypothetical protein
MRQSHEEKLAGMDPKGVLVRFSPEVRRAFGDLATVANSSEHFSAEMASVLQDWAAGAQHSVYDVLTAFPAIAEETFKHIQATGDKRVERMWREIGSELLERGFMLARSRAKSK